MTPEQTSHYAPLIVAPLVLVILFFRMRGLTRGRRLRLELLWVTPAILLVATGLAMWQAPPSPTGWAWMAAVLVIGGALGWYRGKMMTITVDPVTHEVNNRASPAAVIFILALFAIRYALRFELTANSGWHINAALITDGFLVFALGMFGVQRLEMWLRGSKLLAEARAAKAASSAPSALAREGGAEIV